MGRVNEEREFLSAHSGFRVLKGACKARLRTELRVVRLYKGGDLGASVRTGIVPCVTELCCRTESRGFENLMRGPA